MKQKQKIITYKQLLITVCCILVAIGCDRMRHLSDKKAEELYAQYQEILRKDILWNEDICIRLEEIKDVEERIDRRFVPVENSEKQIMIKQWREMFRYLSEKEHPTLEAYRVNDRVDICYIQYSTMLYQETLNLIEGGKEIESYAVEFYDKASDEYFSIRLIYKDLHGRYELKIYWENEK